MRDLRSIAGIIALLAAEPGLARQQHADPPRPPASGPIARQHADPQRPTAGRPVAQTFWRRLTEYFRLSFQNISSLGEGRTEPGRVYVATLRDGRLVGAAIPASAHTDLTWPVIAADGTVYALQGGRVVRILGEESLVPVGRTSRWIKLVGVAPDGSVLGLVAGSRFGRPAILFLDGTVLIGPAPTSAEDRRRHQLLLQQSRSFADGARLQLRRPEAHGQLLDGMDVYLEHADSSVAVSDCGNENCGQPSRSPDGTRIAFVR